MKNYVVCQICGHKTKQIGYSHLWWKHGIKIAEYKKMFPNAEITCEETKNLLSVSAEMRNPQSTETIEKIKNTMKEKYDANPNHYFKNRNICGENNPFFGKHHSEEFKQKLSTITSKRLLEEYKSGKRISAFKYLGNYQGISSLELEAKELLVPLGFIHNFSIPFKRGCYSIDFALIDKKIGLEIDSKLHDTKKAKERDNRKDDFLLEHGWKIIRISVRNKTEIENLSQKIKEVLCENQINTQTKS